MPNLFSWFQKPTVVEKDQSTIRKNLYIVSKHYKIAVLPIKRHYDISNLHHNWSVFIIGSDKTYIYISDTNLFSHIPNFNSGLLNHSGTELPKEFRAFLDPIWDYTLTNTQLQLYIVMNGHLYALLTSPFLNSSGKVIGASLFVQKLDNLDVSIIDTKL